MIKRAIILGGGGPAVGLALGALRKLEAASLEFDVITGASVGSWLGAVWALAPEGERFAAAHDFFRRVFRPAEDYDRFPVPPMFVPDWRALAKGMMSHATDPDSYRNLVVPGMMHEAAGAMSRFAGNPSEWTYDQACNIAFNHMIAPNPLVRFWTSAMYRAPITGLSRMHMDESDSVTALDLARLYDEGMPALYHSAFNLKTNQLEMFSNHPHEGYRPITAESLAANSALPFIEAPVLIDDTPFAEGALVHALTITDLLKNHPDLDEIWVCRLLDHRQLKPPETLLDALTNLIMTFAASLSASDVEVLRQNLAGHPHPCRLIEIPVSTGIDYHWTLANLENGIAEGEIAATQALENYFFPPPPSSSRGLGRLLRRN
jgi:predicted acylesterase/phospholipase RssA